MHNSFAQTPKSWVWVWIWEGRIGGQQRDLRGKALPVGGKRLQTRRGVEPLLPGLGAGHPSCGGNRDLADPFRELHWEEAGSARCLLGAVQPPHMCEDSSRFSRGNPRPGPASPPCVLREVVHLRSSQPRAVPGTDWGSSRGHRLLPPTLHPVVSREPPSLSSPLLRP